jgi:recombination protein RecT
MAEQQQNQLATTRADVGSQVIKRVDELCKGGFTMPKDYNYVNAIKASMLVLSDLKDRNGQPALAVCTPASVQQALFRMCEKGLDVSKNQGSFIVRGNILCFQDGYFGKALQVKRIYPTFNLTPRVIYQGDEFIYETDPETGRRRVVKHAQKLENIDGDFVGAYMYIPCDDGGQDLYLMTKKQITTAWSKSSNKSLTVHKEFQDKMICKTIISSACTFIINSHPEKFDDEDYDERTPEERRQTYDADYEEIDPVSVSTPAAPIEEAPAENVEQPEMAAPAAADVDEF